MEKIHIHFFQFLFFNLFIFAVKPLSGYHRNLKTVPVIESCPLHRGSRVLRCQYWEKVETKDNILEDIMFIR